MIVFSATIPLWLKKSVSRYMSETNKSFINLIGDSQEKTAVNVEHLAFQLNNLSQRSEIVLKLLENYSKDIDQSQAIVFCQTKQECDLLARTNEMNSISSDVLHGNLSQRKREQVLEVKKTFFFRSIFVCFFLKNFRQGQIRVLITTDVSARGLDIPQVDLVILTSPPQDWESYVHRSGRTGRAGKPGKAICIYTTQQIKQLKLVQRNAVGTFRLINIFKNKKIFFV
jgi:superfamily II DNA/RNA helicase